jgi:hypothetical protein
LAASFGAMKAGPLADELEGAGREAAHQYIAALDRDHGMVLGVSSMEVRRLVIVEVHRDRDPVEEADPGHRAIMGGAADEPGSRRLRRAQRRRTQDRRRLDAAIDG